MPMKNNNKYWPDYAKILLSEEWVNVIEMATLQAKMLIKAKDPKLVIKGNKYKSLLSSRKKMIHQLLTKHPKNPILIDTYADLFVWKKKIIELKTKALEYVDPRDYEFCQALVDELKELKRDNAEK